jgi:hypothetical protein
MPREEEAFGVANQSDTQKTCTNNELRWGDCDGNSRSCDVS